MTSRWLLRFLLRLMPQKKKDMSNKVNPRDIVYLFAGTFGDFVQVLEPLATLSKRFPDTPIYLCAPKAYFNEFRFLLPSTMKWASFSLLCLRFFKPADLLLTNVIAVYRVRFELVARLSASNSLGFCYGDENGRRNYSCCLRMAAGYRDYINLNLEIFRLIEKKDGDVVEEIQSAAYSEPITRTATSVTVLEPDKVLFHFGSAGLKGDVGLVNYSRIIREVLHFFQKQHIKTICVASAMDADIRKILFRDFPRLEVREYTLEALKPAILHWRGWLVCFNSFMAHYCRYLGKAAVVLHNRQVPVGYDCSCIHRQIVLHPENDWCLDEFREFFTDNR